MTECVTKIADTFYNTKDKSILFINKKGKSFIVKESSEIKETKNMIVLKREGIIENVDIEKWGHHMMFVNTSNDFLESVELIMKNEYIP